MSILIVRRGPGRLNSDKFGVNNTRFSAGTGVSSGIFESRAAIIAKINIDFSFNDRFRFFAPLIQKDRGTGPDDVLASYLLHYEVLC